MALVRINKFGGMIPKLSKRHIGITMAQKAVNCILTRRSLRPLYENTLVKLTRTKQTKTIYFFNNATWFEWDTVVDALRSQIAGNNKDDPVPFERTYFTGGSQNRPQVTDSSIATAGGGILPANSYDLGISAPETAPNTLSPPPSDPEVVNTFRYTYTYIRIWNGVESEGPPSFASDEVSITPGDAVTVNGLSNDQSIGDANVTHKRIYRVATSDIGGAFQFVAQIDLATESYIDSALDESLGIVLASLTWAPPPDDLHSIVNMPNGMMAGLSGNRLCFSEPWQPHAWPIDYRFGMAYTGVSLAVFNQSVIVTTDGMPYIATGVHPAAVSMDKIEVKQACLSKLSTVDMGEYIVYSSANGLVALGTGLNKVITRDYFTQREWKDLNPASMRGYHYDGQYICFYDTGSVKAGFIFDPNSPEAGYTELDFYATAGFSDLEDDILYLVVNNELVKWDRANTKKTYNWKSGLVVAPKPINPGAGQVLAQGYPINLKLYADDVIRFDKDILSKEEFRLPSGYLATDFEAEVTGQGEVDEILIGETSNDLKKA